MQHSIADYEANKRGRSKPLMAAKSSHNAEQTLKEKWKNVGFHCVLSQPLHGGDSSTRPSGNIMKSGSISIVNPALQNVKLIIANFFKECNRL